MGYKVVMGLEQHKGEQMMEFIFRVNYTFKRFLTTQSGVRGSGLNTVQ